MPDAIHEEADLKEWLIKLDKIDLSIDKLGLVNHFCKGKLNAMAIAGIVHGGREEYWQQLGQNPRRINEHIHFHNLIKAYPILINLPFGYSQYLKYGSAITKRAEEDPNFSAKAGKASSCMRIGIMPMQFSSIDANSTPDVAVLKKRTHSYLSASEDQEGTQAEVPSTPVAKRITTTQTKPMEQRANQVLVKELIQMSIKIE